MDMAMYEDLNRRDRHNRVEAISYNPSRPMSGAAPAISMDEVVGTVRVALLSFLLLCWVAGAYAGIVYWSLQGSLLGVLASAIVPGIAATSTWWAFTALDPSGRRS